MKLIAIRPAINTDVSFFYSSLLQSSFYAAAHRLYTDKQTYFRAHRKAIDRCLARDAEVLIACDIDDEQVIYGYVLFERTILHYVYVKSGLREFGIANQLLQAAGVVKDNLVEVTHWTRELDNICKRDEGKRHRLIYNPYLLME